jgi:CheY-like chemotaxis protein
MPTVLLAEADRALRNDHLCFLSGLGFQVELASDGLQCLAKLRQHVPDLLILDHEVPWGGGEGVLEIMRGDSRLFQTQVVLLSAVAAEELSEVATAPPVVRTLTKPFPMSALLEHSGATMPGEQANPLLDTVYHLDEMVRVIRCLTNSPKGQLQTN